MTTSTQDVRMPVLRDEATGLFAGADTIILLPHFRTDIVAGIEMKFMTVTSEELRDRLADVIGELRTVTRGRQIVSYIATTFSGVGA